MTATPPQAKFFQKRFRYGASGRILSNICGVSLGEGCRVWMFPAQRGCVIAVSEGWRPELKWEQVVHQWLERLQRALQAALPALVSRERLRLVALAESLAVWGP